LFCALSALVFGFAGGCGSGSFWQLVMLAQSAAGSDDELVTAHRRYPSFVIL